MWYKRLKIGKDDVGSIVEPRLSRRHHWFELTSSLPIFRRLYLIIYETLLYIFVPHSDILEENPIGFTVTLNSTILCDDEPLQYSTALKVSLFVHNKETPLGDYGIRNQLPLISCRYIRAMVKSILLLKICLGENQDVVNKKRTCVIPMVHAQWWW